MKSFAHTVWTSTETGTIALFEPERVPFEEYFEDEPFTYLTYMKEGKLLLLSIGGDGSVGVAIEIAQAFPKIQLESIEGRFEVKSDKIYFGPGESLPKNGEDFEERPDQGEWVHIPLGKYHYKLSRIEDDPDGISFRMILVEVGSFDGVPYHMDGDMPRLEG